MRLSRTCVAESDQPDTSSANARHIARGLVVIGDVLEVHGHDETTQVEGVQLRVPAQQAGEQLGHGDRAPANSSELGYHGRSTAAAQATAHLLLVLLLRPGGMGMWRCRAR